MITTLDAGGAVDRVQLSEAPAFHRPTAPLRSRVAYAAAHVVPRVAAENVPGVRSVNDQTVLKRLVGE